MRDVIDERDAKERISKSIIKYWNVNYIVNQEPEEDSDGILAQLQNAAAEEEARKQAQIEEAVRATQEREGLYNIATGSYSGEYGKKEIKDEVTRGQIDKILQEKTEALRDLIENADENLIENADENLIEDADENLNEEE